MKRQPGLRANPPFLARAYLAAVEFAAVITQAMGLIPLSVSIRDRGVSRFAASMEALDERELIALAACARKLARMLDETGRPDRSIEAKRTAIDAYHVAARFGRTGVRELAAFLETEGAYRAVERDDFESAEKLYRHASRYREALCEATMMPGDLEDLAETYEMLQDILVVNGKGDEAEAIDRRSALLRKRVSRYSRQR